MAYEAYPLERHRGTLAPSHRPGVAFDDDSEHGGGQPRGGQTVACDRALLLTR